MRLILMGPPGAGKGTQGEILKNKFGIPKICTGDILRAEIAKGSPIGMQVKDIIAQGNFPSDQIIIDIVKERLLQEDCSDGYLLDGCPRTLAQAQALNDAKIKIDYVIEINVPDEELVTRLTSRRIHIASGRVYHLVNNPPKTPNIDDITGEPLHHRDDDKEDVIKKRLKVYHELTYPVVQYYKSGELQKVIYKQVDGRADINAINNEIEHILSSSNS